MLPKLTFFTFFLAILFPLLIFSQETLPIKSNFDFEDYKDWADFGNPDYIKGIDTIIALSGKNSVFIESKKGAKTFGAFSFVIPAHFVGKKIKLSGYIKTENVNGFAGLWMRLDPKVGFYNMYDKEVNGTTEWQKYEIELDYDQSAEKIVVGGLLSGEGKMWVDDLEVTLDGKKLESSEKKVLLTSELRESLLEQIDKHKIELDLSLDALLESSLPNLIESIGDKKIVAIGEDTHGTSEFYKLREAITKKLILEKGFNMVVLENPYDDIELLAEGVQTGNLDSLMRTHLFSIYQTREMRSFLDWYKIDEIKNSVQFKGCDDSYWVLPELLVRKLSALDNSEIKTLAEKLNDASNLTVKQYNKKHKKSGKKAKSEDDLSVFIYEAATALEEALKGKSLLTAQLEEYLYNIKTSYINYVHLANKKHIQNRDEMMAQRIARFAKDPDSKIIVWAHNAHISNVVVMDGEIGLMGHNLKEEFGDDYHSIGMSSLHGSYSYIENSFINNDHSYDDELLNARLTSQPENSWERILSEAGKAFYFETLDLAGPEIYENLKLLGYGRETKNDYYKLSPFQMFDSIFFIETTTATNPLFN